MFLEVVATSLADIRKINNSKADKIQFCKNLDVNGLTPNIDDILVADQIALKPIDIMIRTSDDNFIFTEYELRKQIQMISMISKLSNINGVVIGALNNESAINETFLEQVNKVRANLKLTFHQAFDQVRDFKQALNILEKHNIDSVLISVSEDLEKSLKDIKELKNAYPKIKFVINLETNQNIKQYIKARDYVHISTSARVDQNLNSEISIENINAFKEK
ncbi:copper homeostasis protein CutC [Mycoplasma yeatsii]|uniref:copper homeostasis protein CutC n=1 Tax=Mycoplasma yeatsii TaxID=51365 RepID=UPI0005B23D0E|nr:copper homeostasis protein CutC [Mycoplasma yeatsii]AJM71999.1 copper homeostasis protein CutC [Mycoplasma yeatsii GM274B]